MRKLCIWCDEPAVQAQHIIPRSLVPPGETINRKKLVLKNAICDKHNQLLSVLENNFSSTDIISNFRVYYIGRSRKKKKPISYQSGGFEFRHDAEDLTITVNPDVELSFGLSELTVKYRAKRDNTRLITEVQQNRGKIGGIWKSSIFDI